MGQAALRTASIEFVEKNEKVGRRRMMPDLSQKCNELPTMIGRMIHNVLHHVR